MSVGTLCNVYCRNGAASLQTHCPCREENPGQLNLGGSNPAGDTIDFNSFYMTVDGKPFIPIMGEIHFSRLPHEYWEEEILKMKSGGINVISTYVFWNIHEEKEGGCF